MEDYKRSPDAVDMLFMGKPRFVNLAVIAVNALMFLLVEFTGDSSSGEHLVHFGAVYTPYVASGEWYRAFTCMFLHFGIVHFGSNMILLLFLGDMLEKVVGHVRYGVICLLGGLAGSVISCLHAISVEEISVAAGASGCVFAVNGAILYLLIRNRGRIQSISIRQFAIVTVLNLYSGFTTGGVDNYAHVGGLIGGFLLAVLLYRPKKSYNGEETTAGENRRSGHQAE